MRAIPYALSVHHFISSVGADAGFAAIIGLALVVLLFFAHARETANLRRRADEAEDALHRLEQYVDQLARSGTAPPAAAAQALPPATAPASAYAAAPAPAPPPAPVRRRRRYRRPGGRPHRRSGPPPGRCDGEPRCPRRGGRARAQRRYAADPGRGRRSDPDPRQPLGHRRRRRDRGDRSGGHGPARPAALDDRRRGERKSHPARAAAGERRPDAERARAAPRAPGPRPSRGSRPHRPSRIAATATGRLACRPRGDCARGRARRGGRRWRSAGGVQFKRWQRPRARPPARRAARARPPPLARARARRRPPQRRSRRPR